MNLTLATAPTVESLTLTEAKAHLRVDTADDDTYITTLIVVARRYLDGYSGVLGRCLVNSTWDLVLDTFPSDGIIDIPLLPLVSVASINYIDGDGASQLLATSVYDVDTGKGLVRLAYDQSWPATRSVYNAVTVQFVAGYGVAADVPETLKQAMLLLIGHFYENRETVSAIKSSVVPMSVNALIAPYKTGRVMVA